MVSFTKKYERWRRAPQFKNDAPKNVLDSIEWANAYQRNGSQPISDEEREIVDDTYPVSSLPQEMFPRLCVCEGYIPPLVHFGLPISRATLMEYAQDYHLITFIPLAEAPFADPDYDILTEDGCVASMVYTMTHVLNHINKRLAPDYNVEIKFSHSCTYGVFAFFNNYDEQDDYPPVDLIREIAKDLREPLAWWLDAQCY